MTKIILPATVLSLAIIALAAEAVRQATAAVPFDEAHDVLAVSRRRLPTIGAGEFDLSAIKRWQVVAQLESRDIDPLDVRRGLDDRRSWLRCLSRGRRIAGWGSVRGCGGVGDWVGLAASRQR